MFSASSRDAMTEARWTVSKKCPFTGLPLKPFRNSAKLAEGLSSGGMIITCSICSMIDMFHHFDDIFLAAVAGRRCALMAMICAYDLELTFMEAAQGCEIHEFDVCETLQGAAALARRRSPRLAVACEFSSGVNLPAMKGVKPYLAGRCGCRPIKPKKIFQRRGWSTICWFSIVMMKCEMT